MKTILAAIAAAPMLAQPVASTAQAAGTGIRTERVQFATGAASTVIKGRLQGDADVDYLVRAAARRKESSNYTLTIGVTGKALAPTPASMDALIQGTSHHAAAKITCVPFLETKPQQCEAFVIRRGFDGTATVEIPQADAGKRRILFVQGKPVASDATDPLTVTRKGELSVVTLGSDERYEIPDVLVIGD